MNEELFLMDERKKSSFLRWNLDGNWKMLRRLLEMTTKHLVYYINLVDEAEAEYERGLTPILKVLLLDNMLSNSTAHILKESFMEGKSQLMWQSVICVILRNCHNHFSPQLPTSWSVSKHQHGGKILHEQKDYNLLETQMMVSIFSSKYFLN